MKNWTKEDENKVIDLLKNGFTYYEIGENFDKTANAIRGKLFRLGYKYSDSQDFNVIKNCLNCGKEFIIKRFNDKKFCNKSCSATFNNKIRGINSIKEIKYCLNCEKEIKPTNIYCNNTCHAEFIEKENFKKIENGDLTLTHNQYKRFLIVKKGEKCEECGWDKRNPVTGKVPIQLEHIDGNSENHSLNNLKILCPNCHSLTPTFGALNKGHGRKNRYKK